jgi:hypothetical protein
MPKFVIWKHHWMLKLFCRLVDFLIGAWQVCVENETCVLLWWRTWYCINFAVDVFVLAHEGSALGWGCTECNRQSIIFFWYRFYFDLILVQWFCFSSREDMTFGLSTSLLPTQPGITRLLWYIRLHLKLYCKLMAFLVFSSISSDNIDCNIPLG